MTELSDAGCFIVTGYEAAIGDEIIIAFRLEPSEQPMQVGGIIRHHSEAGLGAEFTKLTLLDRLRVMDFLLSVSRDSARPAS